MKTKKHSPKPKPFTRSEVAEIMGLSVGRISQLVSEGTLGQDVRGRFPREQTLRDVIEHFREGAELGALKRSKLEKEGRLLDMEIASASKQVVALSEVESAWSNAILFVRQILMQIEPKVEQQFPIWKDAREAGQVVGTMVDAALKQMSEPRDYDDSKANHSDENL